MSTNKSSPMPRRNPPSPSRGGENGGQLGAFWSTLHAKDSLVPEEKGKAIYDEERSSHHVSLKHDRVRPDNDQVPKNVGTNKVVNTQTQTVKSSIHGKSHKPEVASSKDFEINFFPDKDHASQRHMSNLEKKNNFQDQSFNTFVAEFDTTKLNSEHGNKSTREEVLESEVEKLREQLKEANSEKSEINAKYEKLTAICRSQRQELQDLKQALAARTPSPNKESFRTSPGVASSASLDRSEWKTPSSELKSWLAFPEKTEPKKSLSADNAPKSVRSREGLQIKQVTQSASDFDSWGFGTDTFSAARAGSGSPQMPRPGEGSKAHVFDETKSFESKSNSQPAGWAGF